MKFKKLKSIIIGAAVVVACVGGSVATAHATTSQIDVTVSTNPSMASPDPYTLKTQKDDNEQNYYINLTDVVGTNVIYFTAYSSSGVKMAKTVHLTSGQKNKAYAFPYDLKTASAGSYYRLYAHSTEIYYSQAKVTGKYTP